MRKNGCEIRDQRPRKPPRTYFLKIEKFQKNVETYPGSTLHLHGDRGLISAVAIGFILAVSLTKVSFEFNTNDYLMDQFAR